MVSSAAMLAMASLTVLGVPFKFAPPTTVALAAATAPAVLAPPAAPHKTPAAPPPPPLAPKAPAPQAPVSSMTVQRGDTLSSISKVACGTADDWSGLFAANKRELHSPDTVLVGQVIKISCTDPGYTPPAPPPAPAATAATAAPASHTSAAQVSVSSYSGFQACVIRAESGGNSQVMNSTGHYGLYQFSSSTWAAYGGNPADFGNASVAEQNQVFANAMAAGGQSNWSPYDGC
jgi:LysM repeat protein